MAQTRFKTPQLNVEQIRTEAVKPLFAVAGATELAVDLARGYAAEAQKSAQDRLDTVQARVARVTKVERDPKALHPKALQGQARDAITARVEELSKEARQAQARFEARIAELQKDARDFPGRFQTQVAEAVEDLTTTYAELAERGEKFVAAIHKDGVRAVTAVRTAPSVSTVARRERAVAAAKKPPTKKAPATKTAAKSTAKKAPAKKPAAKKSSTAKSSTAKKASSTDA